MNTTTNFRLPRWPLTTTIALAAGAAFLLLTGQSNSNSQSRQMEGGAAPQVIDDQTIDLIAKRLAVIPMDDHVAWMSFEDRRDLLGAAAAEDIRLSLLMSDAQLSMLAKNRDGRHASLAAFVAWQHQNSPILLQLGRDNIDSKEQAIPGASITSTDKLSPMRQSMVAYLSLIYKEWFGSGFPPSKESFDKHFQGYPSYPNSNQWVYPWSKIMRRAQRPSHPEEWKQAVKDISVLSEKQRIVVAAILLAEYPSQSRAQCLEIVANVSNQARQAALTEGIVLSSDPWFDRSDDSARGIAYAGMRKLFD